MAMAMVGFGVRGALFLVLGEGRIGEGIERRTEGKVGGKEDRRKTKQRRDDEKKVPKEMLCVEVIYLNMCTYYMHSYRSALMPIVCAHII
jgi:hypothetical protein